MAYLDQTTALHTVQTQLTDRHADMLVIGRYQHLYRIIAGTLKSGFRRLTVRQQLTQRDDTQYTYRQTEETRDGRRQNIHCLTGLLFV